MSGLSAVDHTRYDMTRFTANGTAHTRFSLATNVCWKHKDSGEYKTRTEWHRIVAWRKFGEWAGSLKKGAFIEVEGELEDGPPLLRASSQFNCSPPNSIGVGTTGGTTFPTRASPFPAACPLLQVLTVPGRGCI
jgi:single-strand DNA-binding protein